MYEEIGHSLFYLPPEQKKDEGTLKKDSPDSNTNEFPPLPDHLWLSIIYDEMIIPRFTRLEKSSSSTKQLVAEAEEQQ